MFTALADEHAGTTAGQEAADLLRACVHCGFCLATCPTYQLTGDELDSPRGRIYLIKSVFEGHAPTARTQHHLDRCLTCRACESTCPSGVRYGRLIDAGRTLLEQRYPRPAKDRVKRALIRTGLGQPALFSAALGLGRRVRGVLPTALAGSIPAARAAGPWPPARHARRMLVLQGCVQPALDPGINAAAARVLDRLGISLVSQARAGCCGALPHHTGDHAAGLQAMRHNIDVWWPDIDSGRVEAIVMTASGCGSEVREYGHHLRHNAGYRVRAERISALTRDLSEVLAEHADALASLIPGARRPQGDAARLVYHPPCSLQHGQQVRGQAERILTACGYALQPFPESHLCCGSAGSYALLQPELSQALRMRKLAHLEATGAACIATANIGCQTHLQSQATRPVRHWISLIDTLLNG